MVLLFFLIFVIRVVQIEGVRGGQCLLDAVQDLGFACRRRSTVALLVLGTGLLDGALDVTLEAMAMEAKAAHKSVGVLGPREEQLHHQHWRIDPLRVELHIGVESGPRQPTSVEPPCLLLCATNKGRMSGRPPSSPPPLPRLFFFLSVLHYAALPRTHPPRGGYC